MKTNIKTYFTESSVHGLPYIVNRNLHITENVLWVVVVAVSFSCCGLLIFQIGVKYQEDVMVTYTSDTAISVMDVSQTCENYCQELDVSRNLSFFLFLKDSIFCCDFLP
jgi:nitric oxide reductase large subunit